MTFQAYFIIIFNLTLKKKCVKQYKQLKYNCEMHKKHQINLTKFDRLKKLNPRISKDERLNWSKISKLTNFKIHLKLKDQKNI